MSSQKTTIIVLEKSAIIRVGLVNILLEKGNVTYSIEQYAYDRDWAFNCTDGVVYLILSNPSGFEKNQKKSVH